MELKVLDKDCSLVHESFIPVVFDTPRLMLFG
jgi:hypothetical protein